MVARHLDQRLRLHLLRAVDAIEAQRSLIGASAAIGISQPSLTKSLHNLEQILEVQLFERHARGVRPTKAGIAVARATRRVFGELRQLEGELARLTDPDAGSLSIGALPTAATGVLPGAISRLTRSHPQIKVRLEQGLTEDLLPALAKGEIDLLVGRLYEPGAEDSFSRETLWDEPISMLARTGHPLLRIGGFLREELQDYRLLLPSVTQRVAEETDRVLALLGLETETALRSSSFGFIREMLYETDSVSMMPRLMMVGDLLRGSMQIVPLPVVSPPRPAGLVTARNRRLSPAAHALIASLRDYLGELGIHQG